ncbi:ATPase [Spirochaetia bacterium]|nr:ATPase [Spirochaetia bacterium]
MDRYIKRHLEFAIERAEKMFAALLISGARQTGKTRLLRERYPRLPYVTLDDPVQHQEAVNNPGGFFETHVPPVVVDEIQYAPELFRYIKMIADGVHDGKRKKGLFFMSGSQQYVLMKNVSESLAGRIGILNLLGLSRREIEDIDFRLPFLPSPDYFAERKSSVSGSNSKDIWEAILKGCLPELQNPDTDRELFYSAYVKTYIERDVRQLVNIGDELAFLKFMTAMAARTGQLLNYTSIAQDIGLSVSTIERWVSILRASNIIYLLQPYHTNMLKRAIRTPKLYFLDTGLVCYLSGWNTAMVLERGAAAGAIFETYCIAEIIKSYTNTGREPPLYFYRDKEQHEIDVLIAENGTLYPLEIKKHASPRPEDLHAFRYIEHIPGTIRGPGGLICLYPSLTSLGEKDKVIPLGYV